MKKYDNNEIKDIIKSIIIFILLIIVAFLLFA